MRAIRPGADVPDGSTAAAPADPLAAAADLRWSRPDLTAALADHVLESAAAVHDRDRWLAAAGWAVHARSATGDGRDMAADIIAGLPEWGPGALDGPAADRLRVELALVAVNAGEVAVATALLGPVVAERGAAELRGDAFGVLARCAVDEDPDRVDAALACAERAWEEIGSPQRELGEAAVALVAAAANRRSGRPTAAAERAADGLAELERARGADGSGPPSGHLAAALAAEWILSLLDAGDTEQARQGCAELAPRLEHSRPSRQLARLRLAVARTDAVGSSAAENAAHTLGQAVRDAAECDAPDLEALCCSALGAVYERAGRPDFALTTVARGVDAQRRDRSRAERFRTALASLPAQARPHALLSAGRTGARGMTRPPVAGPIASEPVTAVLPTAGRSDGPGEGGPDRPRRSRQGLAVDRAWQLGDYSSTADDAPRNGSTHGEAATAGGSGPPPAGRNGARGPARSTADRADPGGRSDPVRRPDRAEADQRPGGHSAVWDVRRDVVGDSPIGDSLMRRMRADNRDRSARSGGEREAAVPSSSDGFPPTRPPRAARSEPLDAQPPDAVGTEPLQATDSGAAPGREQTEPGSPAQGTGPGGSANRHRLDTGTNRIPPGLRRTATEELEARRVAAGRKEVAPSTFSAEWLAAELADLERIWERISQPAVRPEPGDGPAAAGVAAPAAVSRPAGSAGRVPDGPRIGEDPAEPGHDGHDGHDAEDAPRAGAGRRHADAPDGDGSGSARPSGGRRRLGAAGDREPGGASSGRAGPGGAASSGGRNESADADRTGPGRRRAVSPGAGGTGSDPVDDESWGAGTDDAVTASGPWATAWTMTRPVSGGLSGRRRRADPDASSDDRAGVGDERSDQRPAGAPTRAGSGDRQGQRNGRRLVEPDAHTAGDYERATDGPDERALAAEDEPADGDAPGVRDAPDEHAEGRPGRRRAGPEAAADGDEAGDERPTGRRAATGPAANAEGQPRSLRGARQAANARAETRMLPAVRPEPVSAADAALFGPLPTELLEPVLAAPSPATPPLAGDPRDADGCVVGIDIARDGRRLVGRRSAKVLRTVAEVLAGHLPPDGRIDEDDPGVLTVLAPGWSRKAATEWMSSRLPGLLDGFVCEVDPSGMNLRAAVRDADGPVGAQLLQRLDAPDARIPAEAPPRRGTGAVSGPPPLERPGGRGGSRGRLADRPEPERSAPQSFTRPMTGRHGSGETGVMASVEPGRHEQDTDPSARRDAVVGEATDAAPAEGHAADAGRGEPDREPGGDASRAGPAVNGSAQPRGRRRAAETPAVGSGPGAPTGDGPDPPVGGKSARKRVDASTEGLGLADLLAGALAEYRGI